MTNEIDYSDYQVTIKTDPVYWGYQSNEESALTDSFRLGEILEGQLPGIKIRYDGIIGHGNCDDTNGPDLDVCDSIDRIFEKLLISTMENQPKNL